MARRCGPRYPAADAESAPAQAMCGRTQLQLSPTASPCPAAPSATSASCTACIAICISLVGFIQSITQSDPISALASLCPAAPSATSASCTACMTRQL